MILRIERIAGLGCLRRLTWGGAARDAGPWVGVYAENGAGKSTLVAAMRAAAVGGLGPLLDRRSLPAEPSPVVELLTTAGRLTCQDGHWSGPLPSMAIFDRAFVAEHIFDGSSVGPDQRAQFFRLALGAGEVAATRAVDEAKQALAEAEKRRKEAEKCLEARCVGAGFTLGEVCAVPPQREPPAGHSAVEARLAALEARPDLSALPAFVSLAPVPVLHADGLRQLLDRTAATLSAEALQAVRAHLDAHLDARGEAWLRQGLGYLRGPGPEAEAAAGTCPFCGQPLTGSALALLLPRFFDDAYQRLLEQITRAVERVAPWEAWVASLRAAERANLQARADWAALLPFGEPPELEPVLRHAEAAVALLDGLMREKQARLLDPLGGDPRVQELLAHHAALALPVEHYNAWALAAADRGRRLQSGRQAELDQLAVVVRGVRARLLRGDADFTADLGELERAAGDCARLKIGLLEAEAALAQREAARTGTFLALVNAVLADYGTAFRVRELAGKASTRRLTADFSLALVDGAGQLDLARIKASSTRSGAPRFDTFLSEGDRQCLALAVFFAHCLDTPDPARIVVLDDPFTGLDRFRIAWTHHYLQRLAQASAQVWLLSHDASGLAEALPAGATFLTIAHGPGGSSLEPWAPDAEGVQP